MDGKNYIPANSVSPEEYVNKTLNDLKKLLDENPTFQIAAVICQYVDEQKNPSTTFVDMIMPNPNKTEMLIQLFAECQQIVIEEHTILAKKIQQN